MRGDRGLAEAAGVGAVDLHGTARMAYRSTSLGGAPLDILERRVGDRISYKGRIGAPRGSRFPVRKGIAVQENRIGLTARRQPVNL